MGIRRGAARAAGAVSTFVLRDVLHRTAGNFPGKIALLADPDLLSGLRTRCEKGSVLVVGTNGKTTVTNLLADCLEAAGQRVACNRVGANLDSGVATTLLQSSQVDWGIFEVDELYIAKTAPFLHPAYVVLLDLFRDQLDRMGEIDTIQQSILRGLAASPQTILIYNADDPNCAYIAEKAGNKSVAFGVQDDLGLPRDSCASAQMCSGCGEVLSYAFRQYDQLGSYACPSCGMKRPVLDYAAENVTINAGGLGFDILGRHVVDAAIEGLRLHARWTGAYMVYNLTAIATAALLMGCPLSCVQQAIDAFDPRNGRLQWVEARGRKVLLNLAKNPTGFNQNLRIILGDDAPRAAAFFVNDAEGDGRDPSWIWNVSFEELADFPQIPVFVGGTRANDLQVRMKYAGVSARIVKTAADVLDAMAADETLPRDARLFVIANYTALPPLRAELSAGDGKRGETDGATVAARTADARANAVAEEAPEADAADAPADSAALETGTCAEAAEAPLVIMQALPDLLGVFADGGNATVLAQRARWRGIPVELRRPCHGDALDLDDVDIVVLGGSMSREQQMAARDLSPLKRKLHQFVENDGVILGVCGGFQLLGQTWRLDGRSVPCLGLLEIETTEQSGGKRFLGDCVLEVPFAREPVIGFENHAGTTKAKPSLEPFGRIVGHHGFGNDGTGVQDGVCYKNVFGTYLHGPVLAKSPEVADELLRRALEHRARRTGAGVPQLAPLDDAEELAANAFMRDRLGLS